MGKKQKEAVKNHKLPADYDNNTTSIMLKEAGQKSGYLTRRIIKRKVSCPCPVEERKKDSIYREKEKGKPNRKKPKYFLNPYHEAEPETEGENANESLESLNGESTNKMVLNPLYNEESSVSQTEYTLNESLASALSYCDCPEPALIRGLLFYCANCREAFGGLCPPYSRLCYHKSEGNAEKTSEYIKSCNGCS